MNVAARYPMGGLRATNGQKVQPSLMLYLSSSSGRKLSSGTDETLWVPMPFVRGEAVGKARTLLPCLTGGGSCNVRVSDLDRPAAAPAPASFRNGATAQPPAPPTGSPSARKRYSPHCSRPRRQLLPLLTCDYGWCCPSHRPAALVGPRHPTWSTWSRHPTCSR
jgi:hypothetical protein